MEPEKYLEMQQALKETSLLLREQYESLLAAGFGSIEALELTVNLQTLLLKGEVSGTKDSKDNGGA